MARLLPYVTPNQLQHIIQRDNNRQAIFAVLGMSDAQRFAAYQDLFKVALADDDLKQIRESTHKGWALGNQRFIDQIEMLGKRPAASKGIGRPKKLNRV